METLENKHLNTQFEEIPHLQEFKVDDSSPIENLQETAVDLTNITLENIPYYRKK